MRVRKVLVLVLGLAVPVAHSTPATGAGSPGQVMWELEQTRIRKEELTGVRLPRLRAQLHQLQAALRAGEERVRAGVVTLYTSGRGSALPPLVIGRWIQEQEELHQRVELVERQIRAAHSELEVLSAQVAGLQQELWRAETLPRFGGPRLLGDPALTEDQLWDWYRSKSPGPARTTVPVRDLIRLFLEEGGKERVRGDLAFIQGVLETGWFTYRGSKVPPDSNNFAGVNACDSCPSGSRFPDARTGVRAQVQLLKAYATPRQVPLRFAEPWVLGPPDSFYARGCCTTWMELAGTWATDPEYGRKLLRLYRSALSR